MVKCSGDHGVYTCRPWCWMRRTATRRCRRKCSIVSAVGSYLTPFHNSTLWHRNFCLQFSLHWYNDFVTYTCLNFLGPNLFVCLFIPSFVCLCFSFVCLFVFIRLFVRLFVFIRSFVRLFVCLCLFVRLFVCLFVCVYLFVRSFVRSFFHSQIHPSIHPSVIHSVT